MKKKTSFLKYLFCAASAAVSLITMAHAEPSKGTLKSDVVANLPDLKPEISYTEPSVKNAMRVFWTPAGHRDVGQAFHVTGSLNLKTIALHIAAGQAKQSYDLPAKLLILTQPTKDDFNSGEVVADYDGILAAKGGAIPAQNSWLVLTFPEPIKLAEGNYYFVLKFKTQGDDGQIIFFTVGKDGEFTGGNGMASSSGDPAKYNKIPPFVFQISSKSLEAQKAVENAIPPRVLEVNQKGGTPYKTISDAAKDVRPGDTIRLVPGSGPYREIMHITKSGEPGKPIIIDGYGETVTGFEPLVFKQEGGKWVADLTEFFAKQDYIQGFKKVDNMWVNESTRPKVPIAIFPSVLTYNGKRIYQDATTGQFTDYVMVSNDCKKLTLKDGIDPKGFEIASRAAAVRITGSSYQTYRNIKASGTLNDGYNLHGSGKEEIFENVEGFNNLDEGFSSHDGYECKIFKSKFWNNENGIVNIDGTKTVVKDVEIYDNSGIGLGFVAAEADAENVTIKNSGVTGVWIQRSAVLKAKNISVTATSHVTKPYLTAQESCGTTDCKAIDNSANSKIEGEITTLQKN